MCPHTDDDAPFAIRRPVWAMVSTYPPTACGIATFTRSLVTALSGHGAQVDVVRAVDVEETWHAPGVVAGLVTGDGADDAATRLNEYDMVVIQHEYGIYGGEDGADLLALLDRLTVPVLTVLHTVLSNPTAHQRLVLQSVVTASDLLVTMTNTARTRLVDGYHVDPASVLVIPHGAADQLLTGSHPIPDPAAATASYAMPAPARSPDGAASPATWDRPIVLTWGLLGQGKGIEWGIEAIAALRDLVPRPIYVVAGRTHPRVLAHEGEAYRRRLESRVSALGLDEDVVFDDAYLDAGRLHRLVRAADIVLLPYDSLEQVTSGVLSEAVAAGRPVVSTRFPHAIELLAGGTGLLVDQRDPEGMAAALRRILTEPELAAHLSGRAQTLAPALSWRAVAGTYLTAGGSLVRAPDREPAVVSRTGRLEILGRDGVTAALPLYAHLLALTDDTGLFEHAERTRPRREHGYCVDDVARGLMVLSRAGDADYRAPELVWTAGDATQATAAVRRQPRAGELTQVAWTYLEFVAESQDPDGRVINRLDVHGVRHGAFGVEDCWGRALWGLGTAAARSRDPVLARRALARFAVSVRQRSHWPHAMAFAGLGAVEALRVDPGNVEARALLRAAVVAVGRPGADPNWRWPQRRLTYANGVFPNLLIAAGDCLGDDALITSGLTMLEWLLDVETTNGHLSVTPAGGWGPTDPRPGFDQQPIEVAALADACARAYDLTQESRWSGAVNAAAAWFFGANDGGVPLYDETSGGCRDGLQPAGCNQNQGAESTLAMISTLQHAHRLASAHV